MLGALAQKWNQLLIVALLPAGVKSRSILCKHTQLWRDHISRKNTSMAQTMERTKAICDHGVRTENYPLSFILARGLFSPAVHLRFLLCSWAGVYFKVVFEDVRTDCQDLNVEMLKPWSVLQRAGIPGSHVPAVWSGTTNITDHILLNLL